mmetsp:Transcript_58009/g.168283  ORF Transcript_58009/g.168283 Transcript_58009/m.168283 type:complete len:123 (+) Transcript_58009:628-996(+)
MEAASAPQISQTSSGNKRTADIQADAQVGGLLDQAAAGSFAGDARAGGLAVAVVGGGDNQVNCTNIALNGNTVVDGVGLDGVCSVFCMLGVCAMSLRILRCRTQWKKQAVCGTGCARAGRRR